MRASRMLYLAAAGISLVAVIVVPGWLAGRSTPELGGVVVIPAGSPVSAPAAPPAPVPAAPLPPRTHVPVPGSGAMQVSPRLPLEGGHDDDDDDDQPDDDLDIGDHDRMRHEG